MKFFFDIFRRRRGADGKLPKHPLQLQGDYDPTTGLLRGTMSNGPVDAEFEIVTGQLLDLPDLRGPQGQKGDTGPQGDVGLQGPPGKDGAPGRDGQPGRDGGPGVAGQPGLPGRDGIDATPAEMLVMEFQFAYDGPMYTTPQRARLTPAAEINKFYLRNLMPPSSVQPRPEM